ncbi:MAG: DUF5689 domain-containing protein [Bacteroidota bacterium]
MMNKLTFRSAVFAILCSILIGVSSCVQDDEFDAPNSEIADPVFEEGTIFTNITAVAGLLSQEQDDDDNIFDPQPLDYSNENTVFTYGFNENDIFLEAYVISSDEGGNFFEEIILQDDFENPSIGIKLLIDVNPLFVRYDVGRKIFVKLNGLSVGITNGVLTLGQGAGNEVDKISPADEFEVIRRSSEKEDIVPLPLQISEFTENKTNLFVQLQDVQFNRNQAGQLSYAADAADQFDGERILESCSESSSLILSTSTFADFSSAILASGRGTVNGTLTRNFEGEQFIIAVNTLENVQLDSPDRCDPIELSCGLAASAGSNNLFSDDFETQSTGSLISGNGWTNYIEAGTEGWEAYTQFGTNASQGISARVGSFQSNDASSIAWLITPQIDLDANSGVTFQFETSNSFSDGSTLEVLFSKDWDGTVAGIASATWGVVSDAYVTEDDDFFGAWFESGIVDLSCETGQIYLAFKYVGSGDSDSDGTYELDFVSIDAQ